MGIHGDGEKNAQKRCSAATRVAPNRKDDQGASDFSQGGIKDGGV